MASSDCKRSDVMDTQPSPKLATGCAAVVSAVARNKEQGRVGLPVIISITRAARPLELISDRLLKDILYLN